MGLQLFDISYYLSHEDNICPRMKDVSMLYFVISEGLEPSGKELIGILVKFNAVPGRVCIFGRRSHSCFCLLQFFGSTGDLDTIASEGINSATDAIFFSRGSTLSTTSPNENY